MTSTIIYDSNKALPNPNNKTSEELMMDHLKTKLSEKFKSSIIDLVPEELFNKMMDLATDEFVNGPRSERFTKCNKYWNSTDTDNPKPGVNWTESVEVPNPHSKYNPVNDKKTLPGMIYLILVDKAKKDLLEYITTSEQFQQKWEGDKYIMPIVETILKGNADVFMRELVRNIMTQTMMNTINGLRSNNGMPSYVPHYVP